MIFGLPITFLRQVAHVGLQPEAVLGGGAEGQAGGHLRLQVADGGHMLHVAAGLEHLAGLLHGPAHRPRRHSLSTLSALALDFFSQASYRKKNFQNAPTFHKPLQYGMEMQHEGWHLFCTSGKGAQPLL